MQADASRHAPQAASLTLTTSSTPLLATPYTTSRPLAVPSSTKSPALLSTAAAAAGAATASSFPDGPASAGFRVGGKLMGRCSLQGRHCKATSCRAEDGALIQTCKLQRATNWVNAGVIKVHNAPLAVPMLVQTHASCGPCPNLGRCRVTHACS